ncbi:hypothetical protein LUZ60_009275 [Juncus effusus]|nr:hypothetical protein LUZ60_009275 [Juncus effusus]
MERPSKSRVIKNRGFQRSMPTRGARTTAKLEVLPILNLLKDDIQQTLSVMGVNTVIVGTGFEEYEEAVMNAWVNKYVVKLFLDIEDLLCSDIEGQHFRAPSSLNSPLTLSVLLFVFLLLLLIQDIIGEMDLKVNLLLVLALAISCTSSEARNLDKFDIAAYSKIASGELCEICEDYSDKVLDYLKQDETQTEIFSLLYQACSQLSSFEKQCVKMVDHYVPIFFDEVSDLDSDDFCEKLHVCKDDSTINNINNIIKLPSDENSCELCHQVVVKLLTKLQDPDTQLDIIEMLIKGCTKVKNMIPQCNKLVSQYGPEIISNAETFLKTTDICASTLACKTSGTK